MLAPGLGVGLAPLTALILAILAVALLQVVFYRTVARPRLPGHGR